MCVTCVSRQGTTVGDIHGRSISVIHLLTISEHICRLPENSPARQSLREAVRPHTKKCGRPKLTWSQQIRKDLNDIGLTADTDFINIIRDASGPYVWRNRIVDLHQAEIRQRTCSVLRCPRWRNAITLYIYLFKSYRLG